MPHTNKIDNAIAAFGDRPLGDVKVLMVEDDPLITDLIITSLSHNGCIPYSTLDSEEAIKLAEHFRPDVIILDLMMPHVSGEEILVKLKANKALQDIPVIVFTNKSETADIEHVRALGAAEYFIKSSTDISQLVSSVKRWGVQQNT